MLLGLSEECPARVIRWQKDRGCVVGRRSGGWWIKDDVVVDLGLGN